MKELSESIRIRVTEDDLSVFCIAADTDGLSLSAWARRAMKIAARPTARRIKQEKDDFSLAKKMADEPNIAAMRSYAERDGVDALDLRQFNPKKGRWR